MKHTERCGVVRIRGHHLGLDVAGIVALRRIDLARQVTPQLLVVLRIREPEARVQVGREQRQSHLFGRIASWTDRAPKVLDPDQARRVREERREEDVRRVGELGSVEAARVRDPHVERKDRRGEVLRGIRHVHVRTEGTVQLADRVAVGRKRLISAEELTVVDLTEVLGIRHVRELVNEVDQGLVTGRIVPGQASLSDLDPERVNAARDPRRIAVPVLHPRVLLRRGIAPPQDRLEQGVADRDLGLLGPVRQVVGVQRVVDVRDRRPVLRRSLRVKEERRRGVVRPRAAVFLNDPGDLQAGIEDVRVGRANGPESTAAGRAVEHIGADLTVAVQTALQLVAR